MLLLGMFWLGLSGPSATVTLDYKKPLDLRLYDDMLLFEDFVVILDEHSLLVFDRQGALIGSYGEKGRQEIGQFEGIVRVGIAGETRLAIFDFPTKQITFFDLKTRIFQERVPTTAMDIFTDGFNKTIYTLEYDWEIFRDKSLSPDDAVWRKPLIHAFLREQEEESS